MTHNITEANISSSVKINVSLAIISIRKSYSTHRLWDRCLA